MPSSHQPFPTTTLLLNLNKICSCLFCLPCSSLSHSRRPEPDTAPRHLFIYFQPVHLVTTHPSRTSHDLQSRPCARGTRPPLHGKGQKNAINLLMRCTQSPGIVKDLQVVQLSGSLGNHGGRFSTKSKAYTQTKAVPKERISSQTLFLLSADLLGKRFSFF